MPENPEDERRGSGSRIVVDAGYTLRRSFTDLDKYRAKRTPHGYPENIRRLFAPVDRVHEAIINCVRATSDSLACSMYGWDDAEVNDLFLTKLRDERIPVQLSLDSTQAAGKGEVPLIKQWGEMVGNSLSIGHSSKGAISHLKLFVIDGLLTIGGSTNLSFGGQSKQNNEAVFVWDPVYAAETRARLDVIHDEQLMQMHKHQQKLLVDWAAKKSPLTAEERHKLEAGLVPTG